jgi:predicted ATP-dependent Lon-type protease
MSYIKSATIPNESSMTLETSAKSRATKVLHPHRSADDLTAGEMTPLIEFAVEMRKRTTDQLANLLPSEFSQVEYTYRLLQRP